MVTSEPVRDRMVALTRSMSAATSSTSRSIDAPAGLSKGTITATPVSTFAQEGLSSDTIETAVERGKGAIPGLGAVTSPARLLARVHKGELSIAGIGSDQR